MPDQAEPVAFTLPLTLADYFELRAFFLRRYGIRNSLIFFGFLIIGALVIPPLSGVPAGLMLRIAERNWTYYAGVVIAVFLVVRLLPFVSMLVLWFRGTDLLPVMPPFMGRVCSGYAPQWGVLQTPSV